MEVQYFSVNYACMFLFVNLCCRGYPSVTHSSVVNINASSINGIYSRYVVFIEQRFESTDSPGCNQKFRVISPRATHAAIT